MPTGEILFFNNLPTAVNYESVKKSDTFSAQVGVKDRREQKGLLY